MNQQKELAGEVALVTGGAGYLGQWMSRRLAEAGAHVCIGGRDAARVDALVAELTSAGASASAAVFDVRDSSAAEEYLDRVQTQFGRLDILVNNAHGSEAGTLETLPEEAWTDSQYLAVTLPAQLVRLALPMLSASPKKGGASVINISSMYGVVAPQPDAYPGEMQPNPPHYGAAKAGMLQLTRHMACTLGGRGIRVNAVTPGPFPQPTVCEASADFCENLARRVPLGRIGQPDEVAGPVLFLATAASSYVNGATLPVDGGWTAW